MYESPRNPHSLLVQTPHIRIPVSRAVRAGPLTWWLLKKSTYFCVGVVAGFASGIKFVKLSYNLLLGTAGFDKVQHLTLISLRKSSQALPVYGNTFTVGLGK